MRGGGFGNLEMSWDGYEGMAMYGVDPVQDAAMQIGNYTSMGNGQWDLDGLR